MTRFLVWFLVLEVLSTALMLAGFDFFSSLVILSVLSVLIAAERWLSGGRYLSLE